MTQGEIADLYMRYAKKVNNLAYRMTGDRMAADDITHETFVRVCDKHHTFEGRSDVSTWIYSVAKNACYQHFRKTRKAAFSGMEELIKNAQAEKDGCQYTRVEKKLYTEQIREGCLLGLLRCLPFNQRMAFILAILHDFGIQDVSKIIGKSPNATRILVHRARESLKLFLCKNCSLYDPGNGCRCENLISFSLKKGWISTKGGGANAADIESNLKAFRDEISLYKSLHEKDVDDAVLQKIADHIQTAQTGIFLKKKAK